MNDSGGGYRVGADNTEAYGLATARELERKARRPGLGTGRWPSGRTVLRVLPVVVVVVVLGGWLLTAMNARV